MYPRAVSCPLYRAGWAWREEKGYHGTPALMPGTTELARKVAVPGQCHDCLLLELWLCLRGALSH